MTHTKMFAFMARPSCVARTTLKPLIFYFFVSLLSGCGTLTGGTDQALTITTVNDRARKETVCEFTSDKQTEWVAPGKDLNHTVLRSGKPASVVCVNDVQRGEAVLRPKVRWGTRYGNFWLGFCTISCAIDNRTGASYTYPRSVEVFMEDSE
jgi:hypothetical protein